MSTSLLSDDLITMTIHQRVNRNNGVPIRHKLRSQQQRALNIELHRNGNGGMVVVTNFRLSCARSKLIYQ